MTATETLQLIYPNHDGGRARSDKLQALVLTPASVDAPGTAELRTHASYVPLGPGDVVSFDFAGRIIGLVQRDRSYIVEVELPIPADALRDGLSADASVLEPAEQLFAEWSRHASVTVQTSYSCFISSSSAEWLRDAVETNPSVMAVTVRRTPDTAINLDVALEHADFDGDGGGPWA